MSNKILHLPEAEPVKRHMLVALRRYWPDNAQAINILPVTAFAPRPKIKLPLRLCAVKLPEWGCIAGVDGELLIPAELLPQGTSNTDPFLWKKVDWFLAGFLMLECWHERVWEVENGSIHSYSFLLKKWDHRFWQRAWVNRIAMFLRLWAAHNQNVTAEALFGTLSANKVLMTHDVDAVDKTIAIRFKQGAFAGVNALRLLARGKLKESLHKFQQSLRFLFGHEDWWKFEQLLSVEAAADIQALFHFHADLRPKTLKRWLFDPGYSIKQARIKVLIAELHKRNHQTGLHPGFESWNDPVAIAEQKQNLESVAGLPITACRQHWLRFSWQNTWATQEQCEMCLDTTLMFNDRPGFRNASAIRWQPWNAEKNTQHQIMAEPSVLMDSHFYDYQTLSDAERRDQMDYWLDECKTVHGEMAVLWHPHTLTKDYGWNVGFDELVQAIKSN